MRHWLPLLPYFFLLVSCQNDLTVDLPRHEPEIVIEAYLTVGDSILVRIDETRPYENRFYTDVAGRNGRGADVVLTLGGTRHQLQELPAGLSGTFPYPTLYAVPRSQAVVPSTGILGLEVRYLGRTAGADCVVPSPVSIISFVPRPNADDSLRLDVELEAAFVPGRSYYVVQGFTESIQGTLSVVLPFISDVISIEGHGGVDRVLVRNRGRGIVALPQSPIRYILYLKHIDKQLYDFDVALQHQLDDVTGGHSLLGRDLTEIPSNIQGGVGIFTVMAVDSMSLYP